MWRSPNRTASARDDVDKGRSWPIVWNLTCEINGRADPEMPAHSVPWKRPAGAAPTPRHEPPRGGEGVCPPTCLEKGHEGRACREAARGPVRETGTVRPMGSSLFAGVGVLVGAHPVR